MNISLAQAIDSVRGTSALADALIENHDQRNQPFSAQAATDSPITDELDYEELIDSVIENDVEDSPTIVRELSLVILLLLDQLEEATSTKNKEESELTEKEEEKFLKGFKTSLVDTRIGDLYNHYGISMLRRLSRPIRLLIVTELINYAYSKDKEPSELWIHIQHNNGEV